ncbi:class I SAM-dependent methyltransferase [Sphingomonas koreensis]
MKIEHSKLWSTAIDEYPDALRSFVAGYEGGDILELGGGRRPSFSLDDMPVRLNSYTVNDISADELAVAPPEYRKACFDVSGDVTNFEGMYDVVFSRFLAEHVQDGYAMHRNVYAVLKKGGVAFHLIPTMWASPFVVNQLLPEALGRKILTTFFPIRKTVSPKFPAYYSKCRGNTKSMREMFQEIGYADVEIREFYGHYYYDKLPGLKQLDNFAGAVAARNSWSWYTSFAYIIARK